jgi:hypothetical protein
MQINNKREEEKSVGVGNELEAQCNERPHKGELEVQGRVELPSSYETAEVHSDSCLQELEAMSNECVLRGELDAGERVELPARSVPVELPAHG